MNAYTYKIKEFSNYDGDSFDLTLDLGFELVYHQKCRIYGIDTPELRGGTDDSKAAGRLARDYAHALVKTWLEGDGAYFASENYSGKFGRPLGDIVSDIGDSLRRELLKRRYGVPYHGQAKKDIMPQHESNILFLKENNLI